MLKTNLKAALHLIHSNSFSIKKSLHVFKLDHRWRTTLIEKKLVRQAKNGVSQEHIGPLIVAKIQIYTLTRGELLCTLCSEIPCNTYIYTVLTVVTRTRTNTDKFHPHVAIHPCSLLHQTAQLIFVNIWSQNVCCAQFLKVRKFQK